MIPYGRQEITQDDIDAVIAVLKSDFLTQGPQVPLFETKVAAYCNVKHAIAVNSATSALHIACLALGLGPGDRLWTTPITFVASANCALYCGADVDFVDIDPRTYNISVERLSDKLKDAEKSGLLPKIVVPVHLAGQPCDMESIHALSQRYGFRVIEDASHAIGARYKGIPVGNCQFSDVTVFSFHPVKIVTTAEGGMATTNNAALASRMALARSHGITRNTTEMERQPDGPWYYEQITIGYNYRMTELQAALGLSQLQRLDDYVHRRNEVAQYFNRELSSLPVTLPWQHPDGNSAFHLYIVRLLADNNSSKHRAVFEKLQSRGIGVNLHYIPVPYQPYYSQLGHSIENYPEAERYYREALSLPMYPTLTISDLETVITVMTETLKS